MRIGLLIGALVATPAFATGDMHGDPPPAPLIAADFDLADRDADEGERWLLPDVTDTYQPRQPPRLRWRGKTVKLRLPIG